MQPEQYVEIDRESRLVDVRVTGMVSPEDAGWLGEDVRAAVLSFGPDIGKHVTLYDLSAINVLPVQTIAAVAESFAHPEVQKLVARKIAVVACTALMRQQVQRVKVANSTLRIFSDRGEALAWLRA